MTALAPGRVARMGSEIAALPLFGCWAEVVAPKTSHHEMLRLSAWRREDGSWHVALEELDDAREELTPHLQWDGVMRDWEYDELTKTWGPKGLAEAVAAKVQDLWFALDRVVGYLFDKMIEGDRHPGSWFQDWVWRQS